MNALEVYLETVIKNLENEDDMFLQGYVKATRDALKKVKEMKDEK